MRPGNWLGIVGGILAAVGAVLPWWSVSVSVGFLSGSVPILGIYTLGGILALVFGILGLVLSLLKPPAVGIVVLVMGLLTALVSVMYGMMLPTVSLSAFGASASITSSFGYWIALVGGMILMAGGPIIYLDNKKAMAAQPMPTAPPMT